MKRPEEILAKKVNFKDSENVKVESFFTTDDNMTVSAMKRYIIGPKGRLGWHKHPWEHLIYIVEGAGMVQEREYKNALDYNHHVAIAGRAFHIPLGREHCIINNSLMKPLIILSIVPIDFEAQEAHDESS